jgi:uncharacterized membrane protein YphA (DoxX/SURF4 family)
VGTRKLVAVWVISVLLAALFVFAGVPKVTNAQQAVDGFRAWGFSDGFRLLIGAAEIAGGIALLIPALATWSALGLTVIMVGAVYTHVLYTPLREALPALVCFFLLLFLAHARRGQALLLSK